VLYCIRRRKDSVRLSDLNLQSFNLSFVFHCAVSILAS
jgi:hypothetical protein